MMVKPRGMLSPDTLEVFVKRINTINNKLKYYFTIEVYCVITDKTKVTKKNH